ncbi:MAG: DUF6092 family protein [Thermoprotei archaeon]
MKNLDNITQDEHFKLLAFLITSARGCVDEPHLYGSLRLIDAASRLINIMKNEGKATDELLKIQKLIEEKKDLVMYNEEEFIKLLDDLSRELAKIIKQSRS